MSGIALSRVAAFPRADAWSLAAFAALTAVALWRGAKWVRVAAASCLFVALGVATAVWHRPPSPPDLDAADRETVLLSGCVVEPPVTARDRTRFLLELEPGAIVAVSALKPPALEYGQRVDVEAKIRRPHNYQNPGAFDYTAYLARRNVYWYASVPRDGQIKLLPGACGNRFGAVLFAVRRATLARIERLFACDEYATAMLEAILIGESSRLEKSWTEGFRRTGTYHALVISGLHVTVLAGVLLFVLRLCMLGEIPALAIAAAVAWLYAGVSGWSAPVVRAAGGFVLYLIARFTYRRGRALNLLAAVAIVVLWLDPGQLFEASFLLSFLSVAALGAIAAPVLELTSGPYRDAPRFIGERNYDLRLSRAASALRVELRLLAETLAFWIPIAERRLAPVFAFAVRGALWVYEMVVISACIQFALALAMIVYFHRVPVTGLTANLLIVPALSVVVPLGFAAVLTGWIWPARVAGWLLSFSAWVAEGHLRYEPDYRPPDPPVWLGVALALSLVALGGALRRARPVRWTAFAVAATLFAVALVHPFRPAVANGRLELAVIDVGQGDSMLAAFPDGKLMLVDGGGIPTYGNTPKPRIDVGEDVVSPYLWSRGIRRLDVIVSTHSHDDHCGGLPALIRNFRPREIWYGVHGDPFLEAAKLYGATARQPRAGDRIAFGGAEIDVLSPERDYEPLPKPDNDDSLVLRIRYGERSFLLTGDIGGGVEWRIASDPAFGPIDVLKVAHHGGRHSTTDAFVDRAHPWFAIASAGYGNTFGHPSPEVLRRLATVHAGTYRTDRDGLVDVTTDGRRIWVRTFDDFRESQWLLPGFGAD